MKVWRGTVLRYRGAARTRGSTQAGFRRPEIPWEEAKLQLSLLRWSDLCVADGRIRNVNGSRAFRQLFYPWVVHMTPSGSLSVAEFLRLVVDPDRLAVLGMAATGPLDIEDAAHRLSMTVGQVRRAVSRLVESGLLDENLSLDRSVLRALAAALPREEPVSEEVLEGPWTQSERQALGKYFVGSRLTEIPVSRAARTVVLERLASEFEVGLRYSEKQVNSTIQTFHPDYAALRRYMVDEGFLTRAEGSYWRSGGRVDVTYD